MKDTVEDHIVEEMERLRAENAALKNWIISGKELPTCVVCGKPIANISIQRMTRAHLWHDRKCFQYKPRKIIALEQEYGMDIVEILKETTRRYGNIKAQCNALGISIPYLYAIIRKYCGSKFVEFMAANSVGARKAGYMKKLEKPTDQ